MVSAPTGYEGYRRVRRARWAGITSDWTSDDIAWVAAILDGEGWIGIVRVKSAGSRGGIWYRCGITVVQNEPKILDRLHELLKGCGTRAVNRHPKGNRKDVGILNVFNQYAVGEVLAAVLPRLVTKRRHAELVLAARTAADQGYSTAIRETLDELARASRELHASPPMGDDVPLGPGDLVWLAGLVDGEGVIGINKFNGGRSFVLRICIGMTDETIVRRAHAVASVGRFHVEPRPTADLYRWTVEGRKALELLVRISPHLIRKKEHVHVAQTFYEHGIMPRGAYVKGGLPKDMLKVQVECYDAMRRLNWRGKRPFPPPTVLR